ncbi:FG-GAP repeat domain-containing protein [Streptomyces tanashiensis]|uniref:VCBS repeat-containing protein n=2 Tax=Streptomyces tanashiensis TaxID=67367 RepID=A0ABY6R2A7_9ACTN|nr:VCBS repeat-containing protein [Streptomyces tanashiensis]UZX23539.1 VCBS repeat-containing protein [Streptomyces tanashiensis]
MRSVHFTRARLGACTALALAAGMLLASPASAGAPAPRPAAEKPVVRSAPQSATRPASGAFRQGAAAAAGVGASPQLSDFDGDGGGDLIYRDPDGKVYTTTTSGQGGRFVSFPEPPKDIVPVGNQDGNASGPEILALSAQGVLSLYADATPTAATLVWRGNGWGVYSKVAAPGDVNDDGRADLVARDRDGVLWLYYATGDRTAPFASRVRLGGGWNVYDHLFGIGDNNGDGWADLLARDTAGTLWLYAGTGDKSTPFAARKAVGSGWGTYNQVFPVGDDDGDGNGELIARDLSGTLWYYTGKGDGTLAPRQQLGGVGDWASVLQFGGAGNNPVTGEKEGVFARDTAGTLFWYGSTNGGRLSARGQVGGTAEWRGANFAHLSSMDADASSDLAEIYQGRLYIDSALIGGGWDIYNTVVGPGDLSGDGKGDLLARDRSGVLYLYKGNGAGTAVSARVKVGGGWGAYDRLVGAGDHTGDGRTDLVARTPGGDLYLYAGTGVATAPFKARLLIGTGWNTYSKIVAPGDLNADGKADLLGITSGGDLYRYLNTSAGKFTARARIGTGYGIYDSVQ